MRQGRDPWARSANASVGSDQWDSGPAWFNSVIGPLSGSDSALSVTVDCRYVPLPHEEAVPLPLEVERCAAAARHVQRQFGVSLGVGLYLDSATSSLHILLAPENGALCASTVALSASGTEDHDTWCSHSGQIERAVVAALRALRAQVLTPSAR